MPTRPHVRRRAASGTATGVASDTEGGRAFLQERLAIWAKVGFLIVASGSNAKKLLPVPVLSSVEGSPDSTGEIRNTGPVLSVPFRPELVEGSPGSPGSKD